MVLPNALSPLSVEAQSAFAILIQASDAVWRLSAAARPVFRISNGSRSLPSPFAFVRQSDR